MFKKPKRIPQTISSSSSSRTKDEAERDEDDADIDDGNNSTSIKRRRFRTKTTSSEDESDSDDIDATSSNFLQQARKEQQEQINNNIKKTRPFMTSSSARSNNSSTTNPSMSQPPVLHQYQSVDASNIPSHKDFATRAAEYHHTNIPDKISTHPNIPDSSSSTSTQALPIYKGNQQLRNKFLAGPIRASTYVRTTCRFDYQPDICKDYKETGFCGFGDTCIYLHDRGDSKSGWQMEAEWEEKRKRTMELKEKEMEKFLVQFQEKVKRGDMDPNTNVQEEKNLDGWEEEDSITLETKGNDRIPFACFLCRQAFQEPIVTSCGHYFCQRCILKHVQDKSTACPICSKDTNGVFNHPMKLVAKKRRVVGLNGTWEEFERKMKS